MVGAIRLATLVDRPADVRRRWYGHPQRERAEVRPLLVTHGGPVLMVQMENECDSYESDSLHKERRPICSIG